jgi:hypothetical protein
MGFLQHCFTNNLLVPSFDLTLNLPKFKTVYTFYTSLALSECFSPSSPRNA